MSNICGGMLCMHIRRTCPLHTFKHIYTTRQEHSAVHLASPDDNQHCSIIAEKY